MKPRLVRYADLIPCRTGSDGEEHFAIFDDPAEGRFAITALRMAGGCSSPQASSHTAQVAVVHSGEWRLWFGPNREQGSLDLSPGDIASISVGSFRGWEKLDSGKGFLWMPLGAVSDIPPDVELSIDTANGAYELRDSSPDAASHYVVRENEAVANAASPLAAHGIEEAGLIVPQPTGDRFGPGTRDANWLHGFNLRRITLPSGAYVPLHARKEAEILFVQTGTMEISWDEGAIFMGAGDSLSAPIGLPHAFRNTASALCVAFVVRGSEDPALPG